VSEAGGVAAIALGVGLGASVGWRWRSITGSVALAAEAIAGALLAIGALAVQDDVNAASWLFAPLALAGLSMLHARALFGRPGRGGV